MVSAQTSVSRLAVAFFFLPTPPNLLGSRTLVRYVLSQTHTREEPIQVAYVLPKGPTPNRQLRGFVLKGYRTEAIRYLISPPSPPKPWYKRVEVSALGMVRVGIGPLRGAVSKENVQPEPARVRPDWRRNRCGVAGVQRGRLMVQRKRASGVGGVTGRSSTTKSSARRAQMASSAVSRAGVQSAVDGICGGTRIRPRSSQGIRLLCW